MPMDLKKFEEKFKYKLELKPFKQRLLTQLTVVKNKVQRGAKAMQ